MHQQIIVKNGIVYLARGAYLRGALNGEPRDPIAMLDDKRADTRRCATDVTSAALALGAERSITEQREEAEPVGVAIDLKAEQRIAGAVIVALSECPSAAKAAGITAADVREDLQAADDAQIIAGQAGPLARGAREEVFVLGHGLWAVVDRARDGLVEVIDGAGTPEEAAAARDDLESLEAPLRLEAEAKSERAAATRQGTSEIAGKVEEAGEVARFHGIVARLREGGVTAVPGDDILWARDFAQAHPGVNAPAVAPAPAAKRRKKGR